MTWQSMIFLKQLKTIQKTEHGMLWIDYDNSQITNVICTGEEEKAILDYIAEKWIDFFSMLLSVISIIISIIALLK